MISNLSDAQKDKLRALRRAQLAQTEDKTEDKAAENQAGSKQATCSSEDSAQAAVTRDVASEGDASPASYSPAWQFIGDMSYAYNADIGLAYASPVRGVWNIVHIATLVPGGHQVFVCPTSCLRGVVLTTAEMGRMDKMSTITVGEDNILEGDMEEMLQHGVERIIRELPERPRMMMIFTSCIHHFMAVNYKRVYKILAREYPDIDFVDCYMDPIMRRTNPVVPVLWRQMHRVLRPTKPAEPAKQDESLQSATASGKSELEVASQPSKSSVTSESSVASKQPEQAESSGLSRGRNPKQVNLLANCFPHPAEHCDLVALLVKNGYRVLEANSCKNYDEYLSMGESSCNFFFHGTGLAAAKDLKIRLQQPYLRLRPGYSYDEYDEDLQKAAELAGLDGAARAAMPAELAVQRQLTEECIEEALRVLGDTPISIDYTAADCPLELALFLLRRGFNVESVMIDNFTEREEIFHALQAAKPDLRIYETYGWNIRQMRRGHDGKIVCIGQKSAYFMDSDYFVNEVEHAGMYGYRGLRRLMNLLMEACREAKPMKELVQVKGWECGCCEEIR